jgi:hypothetical protein
MIFSFLISSRHKKEKRNKKTLRGFVVIERGEN